jgi:hypothetical protein
MKKITLFSILLIAMFASCKKADLADSTPTGEALVGFTLKSPNSGTNVVLNAAIPNAPIEITWNPSKPGLNTAPTYTWVAALKSVGNFDAPLIEIPGNNAGKDAALTLTYKQLDDALKAKGIADGAQTDLIWTIRADNSSVKILAQNVFNLTVKRFSDGASPFFLLGPQSSTTSVQISPTSTTNNLKFNWTKSVPAKTTSGLKYLVSFYADDANMTRVFSMPSNNNGSDSLLTISWKAFSDSLVKYGYTDFSSTKLKWTVAATSGTWVQQSDYINQLYITRLIQYNYPQALNVAGNFQGWDPGTAPQLVALTPAGGPYTEYSGFIDFGSSAPEFKIIKGNNWGAGDYGSPGPGVITNGGDNFKLASGGNYFLKVNTGAMTWSYNKIDSWGVIGSATPNGWDSDKDMTYNTATKLWTINVNLTVGEMKFRTNDDWAINFGDDGADKTPEFNGANIQVKEAGNYTVILSLASNGNWKYSLTKN